MNWGKGIVLGLATFMAFVIVLVVMMFKSSDDSYDKDYYEKGLDYDAQYMSKKNVISDNAAPSVTIDENTIQIKFLSVDSGKVLLYRPSNNRLDKTFKITDEVLTLDANKLNRGEWKMIAEWSSSGKTYLYEKNIFIQ